MKYMGSKSRIAKQIIPIIQQCINDNNLNYYLEPFVGGANVIDKINCKYRFGYDVNKYLIALLEYMANDGQLLPEVSRELYNNVRTAYNENKDTFDDITTANVGFLASYNGRWFDGGYAQPVFEKTTKGLRLRDYYQEGKRNLEAQISMLKGIEFECIDYKQINQPKGMMIYCDPPYENVKQFANSQKFDYIQFWEIMRQWSVDNYVIISELNAPDDFICIWQKDVQRSIKSDDSKIRAIEKMFVYKDGLYAKKYCRGEI